MQNTHQFFLPSTTKENFIKEFMNNSSGSTFLILTNCSNKVSNSFSFKSLEYIENSGKSIICLPEKTEYFG